MIHRCGDEFQTQASNLRVNMSSNRPSSGKKSGKRKFKQASRGALPFVIGGVVGVGLVVGLSVWYFSGKEDSAPAGQPAAVAPSESVVPQTETEQLPTPEQLVKFEHAVGGFSCEMPGTPERQPQTETPGHENYLLLAHGESAYFVYYTSKRVELDDSSSVRSFLKKWADVVANGGPVSDEVFSIDQGCWVLSAKMVLPGGITRHSRFYYHRSSIVEFSMGFKAAETPKEMERFFRSIRLTP